ncbi:MAG TPA: amidase [Gammaproteobacteria bacterium]|nr:amidase [Gammaproteobacteria bacterium]
MTTRDSIGAGGSPNDALSNPESFGSQADLRAMSIVQAAQCLRARSVSSVELTQAYLAAIERLQPSINAYITVTAELALEQAREREAELAAGRWRGPLHGIPMALKDNIDTAGIRTTAASPLLAGRVPIADAEVYRRLRAAGAVLLGKLNMHEWAYGGTSVITHFGPVHNPWKLDRIAGGSSGGSAAAVAAGMCAAAIGTDTLASIRQPAAYCGIVGFKASHGLASIRGIIPVSESLDHVGPLARSVGDAALVLQAIAGYDPHDPVSLEDPLPTYISASYLETSALRLGIPRRPFYDSLDPDIEGAVEEALKVLQSLAASVREVALPPAPDFSILLAEAYTYHREHLARPENHALYNPVTLERILAAGQVPAASYIEARRDLALARRAIAEVFTHVDLLVTPTTPQLPEAIRHAQNPDDPAGAEPSVRNTAPFNLFGIPTLTLPCGLSRSGLPIGLQISGPRLGELEVLALAYAYEQATKWHEMRPPLA